MTVAKTTDGGKDRGIAFLKQKQHDRRMKMTEKLFAGLRVVFGSRSNEHYKAELKSWARNEYGKDWVFAYNYMLEHDGKPPHAGIWR